MLAAMAERIVVVGISGAGKSTFARMLAARIGAEHVELDRHYWRSGWTTAELADFRSAVEAAVAAPRWVVDGNYRAVRDLVWPRADTIVWINYSFARVLRQSLVRAVTRIISREELWHGNRESFRKTFLSRESILLWVVTMFHRRRRELSELRSGGSFGHLTWHEVRQPKQLAACLEELGPPARSSVSAAAQRT
ncbi:AAA family ATPase [soil metagenome]